MSDVAASSLGAEFVPHRAGTAYTVELDGEAVVLDEEQNRLHLLNRTATLVWACCDGSGTVAEIAADLAESAGVPTERVTAEVVALVRTLGAEGLLDGVRPDADPGGVAVDAIEVS